MNTELTLNIYSHFPDIKKLTKEGHSQYDYITLLFDTSFIYTESSIPKKFHEKNFVFTTSLFIDYYVEDVDKKYLSLNFDIMETNDEGIALECYIENKKYTEKAYKPKTFKKAQVERKYDVNCKKEYSVQLSNQYQSISEALDDFYINQIEPKYLTIEPFLIKNNISYDKIELDIVISESLKAAKECFKKEYLKYYSDNFLMQQVNEVDIKLSAQNLQNELPLNSKIAKKNKL